jgi:hypothetical protein
MTSIPTRANKNGEGEQYFPVFNVMKTRLENEIGKKLRFGGLYHIAGDIEGAFDFDIHRIVKCYFRMVTPLEYRDRVEFGKVYNLRVRLIEEIQLNERQREILANSAGLQYRSLMYRLQHTTNERVSDLKQAVGASDQANSSTRFEGLAATFSPIIRLQSGRDPRLYFRLLMSSFKKKTGIVIEEGGFYRIGVRIDGVGSFQKSLRSMAARQDIPFYVPIVLRDKLEAGRPCEVTIEWVEKLPRPNDWRSGEKIDANDWSWREVASWIDTEGTIHAENRSRYLSIGQKEKKVIQEICAFLENEGISSSMRLDRHTGVYYVVVNKVDDIARVIRNIEPYIRTVNKRREIEVFKEELAKPRAKLKTSVMYARRILGIEKD